ncbi:hypothetical protein L873DRAFT_1317066 [Choiromyces venosus 120613-1]|uniref:Uncharacterized protein n=1 Tax=Choiromyces venosus 120613-1 TaxID=1336337 RepID=A0A3N4JAY7_9PEZI|nr:hypothetical protein L873DRAFT_1317066 [Choiromyces venosus 120613-1]
MGANSVGYNFQFHSQYRYDRMDDRSVISFAARGPRCCLFMVRCASLGFVFPFGGTLHAASLEDSSLWFVVKNGWYASG